MAVRRLNGDDDDFIDHSIGTGGMDDIAWGAFTVVAVAKRETPLSSGMGTVGSIETASSARAAFRYNDDSPALMDYLRGEFASGGAGPQWTPSDGWVLVAWTKTAGTTTVRYHKGVLDANPANDVWTHSNSAGTVGNDDNLCTLISTRFSGDSDRAFHGLLAARAFWDLVLGGPTESGIDDAIEALRESYSDWLDLNPICAHKFDQTSTLTDVDDDTGNGADQTAIQGTTVVLNDDPPGFDFGGSAVAELAPAVVNLASVAVVPVPQQVQMDLVPAVLDLASVSMIPVPQVVNVDLVPTVVDLSSIALVPLAANAPIAETVILEFWAQPFTMVPGPVTTQLVPAVMNLVAVPIGQLGANVDITVTVSASRIGSVLIGQSRGASVQVAATREARGN